jgi:hypothetical protein
MSSRRQNEGTDRASSSVVAIFESGLMTVAIELEPQQDNTSTIELRCPEQYSTTKLKPNKLLIQWW